ncbi:serine protease [Streptomyces sp. SID13588]|uniref:trypsin-like serine protease n=1 Tax=Streptomyces sp. SID13588 TaxID=2706051 RepID=UPI0013CC746A|nr:serine protease [Streptomyces sp. SID13588]
MASSPTAAVVGGNPAATTDVAPYLVSVNARNRFGGEHICGGFLRDATTVITTAHCVDGRKASDLSVKFGGLDRNALPQTHQVDSVKMYAGYNAVTKAGDVGILKLKTQATAGNGVQFAKLATSNPAPGTMATVTGWGRLRELDTALPTAQHTVQVPITTAAACQAAYPDPNVGGPVLDTGSMLCAGPATGGQGICQGDFGDPLVVNGTIVGIASWARGCAEPNSPGVYSSIAHYLSWLEG